VLEQAGRRGLKGAVFQTAAANDRADGFKRLQASMPPEDFKLYINRPDLRRLLRQTPNLIAGKQ
jgi:hypothetical protein